MLDFQIAVAGELPDRILMMSLEFPGGRAGPHQPILLGIPDQGIRGASRQGALNRPPLRPGIVSPAEVHRHDEITTDGVTLAGIPRGESQHRDVVIRDRGPVLRIEPVTRGVIPRFVTPHVQVPSILPLEVASPCMAAVLTEAGEKDGGNPERLPRDSRVISLIDANPPTLSDTLQGIVTPGPDIGILGNARIVVPDRCESPRRILFGKRARVANGVQFLPLQRRIDHKLEFPRLEFPRIHPQLPLPEGTDDPPEHLGGRNLLPRHILLENLPVRPPVRRRLVMHDGDRQGEIQVLLPILGMGFPDRLQIQQDLRGKIILTDGVAPSVQKRGVLQHCRDKGGIKAPDQGAVPGYEGLSHQFRHGATQHRWIGTKLARGPLLQLVVAADERRAGLMDRHLDILSPGGFLGGHRKVTGEPSPRHRGLVGLQKVEPLVEIDPGAEGRLIGRSRRPLSRGMPLARQCIAQGIAKLRQSSRGFDTGQIGRRRRP